MILQIFNTIGFAQNFVLRKWALSSAGGNLSSSSYILNSSAGQVITGESHNSYIEQSGFYTFEVIGPGFVCGDADGDGIVTLDDINYLATYLFYNGPSPTPWKAGDVNGDCLLDSKDLSYYTAYIFHGGPVPLCCPGRKGTVVSQKKHRAD